MQDPSTLWFKYKERLYCSRLLILHNYFILVFLTIFNNNHLDILMLLQTYIILELQDHINYKNLQ